MPIKDWLAGEQPSAADMNRYFMQQHHALKTVDESVTNSTVLQDDNELFVPVQAGTDYWVSALIIYEGPENAVGGDLKMGWSVPSGSTFDWVSDSLGSNASSTVEVISRSHQTAASQPAPGTVGIGTNIACIPKGVLRVGASSGIFRFRWAQLNATAVASVRVKAGSILTLRRLTD
jgi:hypothetical protein